MRAVAARLLARSTAPSRDEAHGHRRRRAIRGQHVLPWIEAGGDVDVGFTLRADALTAMMLVMVTFIGT